VRGSRKHVPCDLREPVASTRLASFPLPEHGVARCHVNRLSRSLSPPAIAGDRSCREAGEGRPAASSPVAKIATIAGIQPSPAAVEEAGIDAKRGCRASFDLVDGHRAATGDERRMPRPLHRQGEPEHVLHHQSLTQLKDAASGFGQPQGQGSLEWICSRFREANRITLLESYKGTATGDALLSGSGNPTGGSVPHPCGRHALASALVIQRRARVCTGSRPAIPMSSVQDASNDILRA
jgi:hypothetical protein